MAGAEADGMFGISGNVHMLIAISAYVIAVELGKYFWRMKKRNCY
jgi:hypothetical protein